MADLSDEELAELRKLGEGGAETALEWRAAVLAAHPFLLAEIERRRVQELLDAPETPEEKAALDKLPSDPERILARGRARLLAHEQGRKK